MHKLQITLHNHNLFISGCKSKLICHVVQEVGQMSGLLTVLLKLNKNDYMCVVRFATRTLTMLFLHPEMCCTATIHLTRGHQRRSVLGYFNRSFFIA